MKIKNITLLFCFLITTNLYAQSVGEILFKSKQATFALERVKMKGKTMTDSVNATHSEGAMDYAKRQFFATERKDSQISSTIYFKEGITYLYDQYSDSWLKFDKDLNLFDDILDKVKLFSFFPDNFENEGFDVELVGEEVVEGEPCYRLRSQVSDLQKAKKFVVKFLDKFVPKQIASQLAQDQDILDHYLKFYFQNSEFIHWISKDTFFVVKTSRRYRKMVGPDQSVAIVRQITYYDFNKPLRIDIPEKAQNANFISAENIGLGM